MPVESIFLQRTDGKGAVKIAEKPRAHIGDAIARRWERARNRAEFGALLRRIVVLAAVVWLILNYGFMPAQNKGQDMTPALKDGDLCVVYRSGIRSLLGERLAAGDIVCFRQAGARRILRVAAVAGDEIRAEANGSLRVNGAPQSGEILYPTYARDEAAFPMTVPEGCVFVLGDNRQEAADSRDFGPVSLESVEGKVISILRRRGL